MDTGPDPQDWLPILQLSDLFSAVKGGAPVSMSYMSAPRDHQSTACQHR